MGEAGDKLLAMAEVAVALAGFAAIIVVLKRGNSGKWSAVSADQFHGMVIHAVAAFLFCLLPMVVDVVVQDVTTTLHYCVAILGAQILIHTSGVMFMRTTNVLGRISLLIGFVFGAAQFLVFTDWGYQREFVIYMAGIIWHILQAGMLFIMLVWIPREDYE